MNLKKKIISTLIFAALLLAAYFFVFKNYSINEFIQTIKNCKVQFIILAIMSVFLFVFFEGLFFKIILKKLGYKINWYQAFGYVFTEIYFSGITPSSTGGQPVQMIEMNKDNIPYRVSTIVVLINTMFYKLALLLIVSLSFIFYHSIYDDLSHLFRIFLLIGYLLTLFIVLFFMLLTFNKKSISILIKILSKIPILKNRDLNDYLKDYIEAAKYIKKNPKLLSKSFIVIFLQRISLLLVMFFVYKSFGINISLLYAIAIQSFLVIATDFMPIPGALVISEALFMEVNDIINITSISESITIIFRSISFYALILVSLLYYILFHIKKRKPAEIIEKK